MSHTPEIADVYSTLLYMNKYSLLRQTVFNGASEMGIRSPILSAASTDWHYFGLSIPEGKRLHIWKRDLSMTQGRYEVDLKRAPSGFTGGGLAYKTKLFQASGSSVTSELYSGVTPVNEAEVETLFQFPLVDTGQGTGESSRAQGAGAVDGSLKAFDTGTVLLAVRRTAAADYTASINLIVWEEDIHE